MCRLRMARSRAACALFAESYKPLYLQRILFHVLTQVCSQIQTSLVPYPKATVVLRQRPRRLMFDACAATEWSLATAVRATSCVAVPHGPLWHSSCVTLRLACSSVFIAHFESSHRVCYGSARVTSTVAVQPASRCDVHGQPARRRYGGVGGGWTKLMN